MKDHINLRYIKDKIATSVYWKMNADKPWLTKAANNYLEKNLKPQMLGIEYGSGRSTLWIAQRIKHLVSVEGNKQWYDKVKQDISSRGVSNVEYFYKSYEDNKSEKNALEYSEHINNYEDNYFDLIFIDGGPRGYCTKNALTKLKSKGMLVIDNINWYIPTDSKSPSSIPLGGSCADDVWTEIWKVISKWDCHYTSSGVTDTAIYIKP